MIHKFEDIPLVSIIVNNYNYGRFLNEAIDSALAQTYPHIEVIIVDDGSTDNSREIIASYGDRIIPVLKENGGQASAFNVGFAACKGEITIFLDSDDALLPHIVQQVVEVFQAQPDLTKVQYQLRIIDAEGKATGKIILDSRFMPSGDLRQFILKFHTYGCPPTSGNAFSSKILRQIMPMPEAQYRIAADEYINNILPLLGAIFSIGEVGGLYRMHGKNNYCRPAEGLEEPERLRKVILQNVETRTLQREFYNTVYSKNIKEIGKWELGFLKNRVSSLKLEPINHPFKESLLLLCIQGVISSWMTPSMRLRGRLLFSFWFITMFFIPKAIAKPFTETLLYPEERRRLINKVFSRRIQESGVRSQE